ncbi:MAG: RICIN domain-containing protein [Solirubrobacterales bacterium]|nr:RICIN domain-containing protein [Solirubrobacterales bacterium]
MKHNRLRMRVRVACALAAIGLSAMLAGGALANQAVAAAGGSQPSKLAQRAVVRLQNLPGLRARLQQLEGRTGVRLVSHQRQLPQRGGRFGARRPALARVADVPDEFNIILTPASTYWGFSELHLDVGGASTSPGAGVIDWWPKFTDNANQGWTFYPLDAINPNLSPNLFFIINDNSGLCMESNGVAGAQVYQNTCGAAPDRQAWDTPLRPNSYPTSWSIQNHASGLMLDVYNDSRLPGAFIDTWPSNGAQNQQFAAW